MNSQLPSYEATVSTLPPLPRVNYRLYVQYDSSCQSQKLEPIKLRTGGAVVLCTSVPPLKTYIRPNDEPINEILKKSEFDNSLTIVFEGEAENELKQLSKMFTSLKHWNSFSYAENLSFAHQYSAKAVKHVMKNSEKKLKCLVLNFSSFRVVQIRNHTFTGHPKGETNYTLHVIFQKQKLLLYESEGEYELLYAIQQPISCTILEQEEILEFDQNCPFTGPKAEVLIKGDSLTVLQEIRNAFMNFELPNPKASCIAHSLRVHNSCLEVLPKTPDSDKFVVNFSDWTSQIQPYFLYG